MQKDKDRAAPKSNDRLSDSFRQKALVSKQFQEDLIQGGTQGVLQDSSSSSKRKKMQTNLPKQSEMAERSVKPASSSKTVSKMVAEKESASTNRNLNSKAQVTSVVTHS